MTLSILILITMITPKQIRAARALLGWTQEKLAECLDVSRVTIHTLESERTKISHDMADKIESILSRAGIIFFGDTGVSLGETNLKVFDGNDMLKDFYRHVYDALRISNPIIRISGVDETMFRNRFGEASTDEYIAKVSQLKKLDVRVLTTRSLMDRTVDYAQYKVIDDKYFFPVPVYLYLNKVAFILWHANKIVQIEDDELFTSLALQFDFLWDNSSI